MGISTNPLRAPFFFSCQGTRVRWGITSNRITDEVQLARVDATFPTFPALILPLSFAVVAFILSLSFKTREKKDVMCGQNGQYGFSSMFKGRSLEGYGKTQNSGLFFLLCFLAFSFWFLFLFFSVWANYFGTSTRASEPLCAGALPGESGAFLIPACFMCKLDVACTLIFDDLTRPLPPRNFFF